MTTQKSENIITLFLSMSAYVSSTVLSLGSRKMPTKIVTLAPNSQHPHTYAPFTGTHLFTKDMMTAMVTNKSAYSMTAMVTNKSAYSKTTVIEMLESEHENTKTTFQSSM